MVGWVSHRTHLACDSSRGSHITLTRKRAAELSRRYLEGVEEGAFQQMLRAAKNAGKFLDLPLSSGTLVSLFSRELK